MDDKASSDFIYQAKTLRTIFTNPITQYFGDKLGWETRRVLKFSEYRDKEGKLLFENATESLEKKLGLKGWTKLCYCVYRR